MSVGECVIVQKKSHTITDLLQCLVKLMIFSTSRVVSCNNIVPDLHTINKFEQNYQSFNETLSKISVPEPDSQVMAPSRLNTIGRVR